MPAQTVPGGLQSNTLKIPKYNDALVLAPDVAKSFTVPVGTVRVILSCTNGFWCSVTDTAVEPSGDVDDGSASFYVGSSCEFAVAGGEGISVVSASSALISASFYTHS